MPAAAFREFISRANRAGRSFMKIDRLRQHLAHQPLGMFILRIIAAAMMFR